MQCKYMIYSADILRLYSMQMLLQVVRNVDQIPVGNEISGVITKGMSTH